MWSNLNKMIFLVQQPETDSMEDIIKKAIYGGYTNKLLSNSDGYSIDMRSRQIKVWRKIPEEFIKPRFLTHSLDKQPKQRNSIHFSNLVIDPFFWQALGKACGWPEDLQDEGMWQGGTIPHWEYIALRFHQINFGGAWDKAVEYLKSEIEK